MRARMSVCWQYEGMSTNSVSIYHRVFGRRVVHFYSSVAASTHTQWQTVTTHMHTRARAHTFTNGMCLVLTNQLEMVLTNTLPSSSMLLGECSRIATALAFEAMEIS